MSKSKFLQFDFDSEDIDGLGEGQKYQEYKEPNFVPFLICPICGLNRPMNRTGVYAMNIAKRNIKSERGMREYVKQFIEGKRIHSRAKKYNPSKETRFDIVNIEDEPFVMYKIAGGKGRFNEVPELAVTYSDIKKMSDNDQRILGEYVEQIKRQCIDILELFEREGL